MIVSGINLTSVFDKLNLSTQAMESKIRDQIEAGGTGENGTLTSLEMLSLQQDVNLWNLASNLQTNIIKNIGDTIKSTVQNIR